MKILAAALFAVVCLGLVACGDEKKAESGKPAGSAAAATPAKSAAPAAKPAGSGW